MKFKTKFITAILLLLIFSCSEESKLNEKYDCSSVDDCLSKYNFEGARAYASLPHEEGDYEERIAHWSGWRNILVSESNYWVNNGDFKKALQILDADKENFRVNLNNGRYFNEAKYNLISKIIEKLIDDNEFNEARKWVLKCPDGVFSMDDKHKSGRDFREEEHDPSEKMRYILNKKIDEFEKLSK